uniref:Uncharacterized protein n=1 Tax=Cacopsylla melanoneura TaxID=428564 RepID=A0A8D8YLT9_9HEMI
MYEELLMFEKVLDGDSVQFGRLEEALWNAARVRIGRVGCASPETQIEEYGFRVRFARFKKRVDRVVRSRVRYLAVGVDIVVNTLRAWTNTGWYSGHCLTH